MARKRKTTKNPQKVKATVLPETIRNKKRSKKVDQILAENDGITRRQARKILQRKEGKR
jgi:hypothetical protein